MLSFLSDFSNYRLFTVAFNVFHGLDDPHMIGVGFCDQSNPDKKGIYQQFCVCR